MAHLISVNCFLLQQLRFLTESFMLMTHSACLACFFCDVECLHSICSWLPLCAATYCTTHSNCLLCCSCVAQAELWSDCSLLNKCGKKASKAEWHQLFFFFLVFCFLLLSPVALIKPLFPFKTLKKTAAKLFKVSCLDTVTWNLFLFSPELPFSSRDGGKS